MDKLSIDISQAYDQLENMINLVSNPTNKLQELFENYTKAIDTKIKKLEEDSLFLQCLEEQGVENWEGYGMACYEFNNILKNE